MFILNLPFFGVLDRIIGAIILATVVAGIGYLLYKWIKKNKSKES